MTSGAMYYRGVRHVKSVVYINIERDERDERGGKMKRDERRDETRRETKEQNIGEFIILEKTQSRGGLETTTKLTCGDPT